MIHYISPGLNLAIIETYFAKVALKPKILISLSQNVHAKFVAWSLSPIIGVGSDKGRYVNTPQLRSIRLVEIAIWPVLPTPKKSQIPIGYRGTVKMYTLYGNPYQLRFSVSRRAVPRIGLVRNVTSRLYYEFCLVENITEQVRRGLVQYITSRPYYDLRRGLVQYITSRPY